MAAELVMVRSEWKSTAGVRIALDMVEDLHWRRPPGSRRGYLYGSIWCNGEVSGDLDHQCSRSEGPHRLTICVMRRANAAVYAAQAERAGGAAAQPPRPMDGPVGSVCNLTC